MTSLLTPLLYIERRLTFKPTGEDYGGLPDGAERITFGEEFGLTLDGTFLDTKSEITILFLHGNRYNITRFRSHYQTFQDWSVSFLTFDYPGYGSSKGVASEQSAKAAVRAAYSFLVHKRGKSPHNIIVYGLSLGAALGSDLLLSHSARGFIAECPFTNTWDMARNLYPYLPFWWLLPNRFRNDRNFPKLKIPLFLFHGLNDRITRWECSQRLFDNCKHPKQLRLIPDAGHTDSLECGGSALKTELYNWIQRPA